VGKGLSQDDISNFEAIFGGEAKSPVTPFPPAGPKPLPGIPGGPPVPQGIPGGIKSPAPLPSLGFALNPLPAPPAKSGGMGSLTDLTSMIQKSPVAPPLAKDKAAGKDELVE
jgi:hypothetical protein